MKIITFRCPYCRSELMAEESERAVYCACCGKDVPVSRSAGKTAKTNQTSSAGRAKISYSGKSSKSSYSAQPKTAAPDVRVWTKDSGAKKGKASGSGTKGPARHAAGIFFLVVIFTLAAVFLSYRAVSVRREKELREQEERTKQLELLREESYENKLRNRLKTICKKDDVELLSVDYSLDRKRYQVRVKTEGSQKETIDSIQKDLLEQIELESGQELALSFECPENNTVRELTANDSGEVRVSYDITNSAADEEVDGLTAGMKDAINKALEGTLFSLRQIDYKNDRFTMRIDSETRNRQNLDDILPAIVDALGQAGEENSSVNFKDSAGDDLRYAEIENGEITVTSDFSNTLEDEETDRLENDYLYAVNDVVWRGMAEVKTVKLQNDEMNIEMVSEKGDNGIMFLIENNVKEAIKDISSLPVHVTITSSTIPATVKKFDLGAKTTSSGGSLMDTLRGYYQEID